MVQLSSVSSREGASSVERRRDSYVHGSFTMRLCIGENFHWDRQLRLIARFIVVSITLRNKITEE